jgi:RNA polymerase sigma-70 factor (ECF subfamily)
MRDDERTVSDAYLAHRPYLVDLAFRMLGDLGAAEDVVQDAFSRLMNAEAGEIEDHRGWLIVVTSRLCLDQIRSARARRERAHDAATIEFIVPPQSGLADPADRITLDDRVRIALLVMLQRLSPAERVVFVLRDVFGLPFGTIAESVGRSAPACRQLARRARQKIAASDPSLSGAGSGPPVAAGEHRAVTEKFLRACATGDIDGLLDVLAPDAWGELVPGRDTAGREVVVTGAERVARNLVRFWGEGTTLVSLPGTGQPVLLGFAGRRLTAVLVLVLRNESIQAVQVIADPRLLEFVGARLPALALRAAVPPPDDVTIGGPVSSLLVPPPGAGGRAARGSRARTEGQTCTITLAPPPRPRRRLSRCRPRGSWRSSWAR